MGGAVLALGVWYEVRSLGIEREREVMEGTDEEGSEEPVEVGAVVRLETLEALLRRREGGRASRYGRRDRDTESEPDRRRGVTVLKRE